jgi:hypothetical protein
MAQSTTQNPLKSFFRKSKFQISLPSEGKWNTPDQLTLNEKNSVDVFAMTATDDMKFKAGDVNLSGQNTYSLIKNCIPQILKPEFLSTLDIDAVILAIRWASYGPAFNVVVNVPKTSLTRKITFDIPELLGSIPNVSVWDEELTVINEDNESITFFLKPIVFSDVFKTSKDVIQNKNLMSKTSASADIFNDESSKILEKSMSTLGNVVVDLICNSIFKVSSDDISETNPKNIKELVNNLDVEYFNAIKKHIDEQRNKFQIVTPEQSSTPEEIAAGADATWTTPLSFTHSNLFTE